jgi:hypothetical protein
MTQITGQETELLKEPNDGARISVRQAAQIAGVSPSSIHGWMKRRHFDFVKRRLPGAKRDTCQILRTSFVEFLLETEKPNCWTDGHSKVKNPSLLASELARAVLEGILVGDGKVRAYHAEACLKAVTLANQFTLRVRALTREMKGAQDG